MNDFLSTIDFPVEVHTDYGVGTAHRLERWVTSKNGRYEFEVVAIVTIAGESCPAAIPVENVLFALVEDDGTAETAPVDFTGEPSL